MIGEAAIAVASVFARGRTMVETVRARAHVGDWVGAAERLDAWALELENAAAALGAEEIPMYDPGAIASVVRITASLGRMHTMVTGAAVEAWRLAAENGARA